MRRRLDVAVAGFSSGINPLLLLNKGIGQLAGDEPVILWYASCTGEEERGNDR